jgi:hypothetical protein
MSTLIIYLIKYLLVIDIYIEAVVCILFASAFYAVFFMKIRVFTESEMKIISGIMPSRLAGMLRRFVI